MTMEIDFLRHYGLQMEHISILQSVYGDRLLPLQERVIREGGLFENKSCLICAPTSSGKTFLTEILFLHHAARTRKVILLVPTKALANQRYRELKERYASLGYDILLSTRDHPFQDRRIQEGRYHLAVVIYEKMRSLLAQDDSWLSLLGACVVDEIHYLYHTTRGGDLELLLTKLRDEKALQIVGLSATLADPDVAEWLRAGLLVETKRPVELRQGVLCRGEYVYREFNSRKKGAERFPFVQEEDDGLAMLEAANYLASKGESTLLFWPRRDQCYTAARKLAQEHSPHSDLDLSRVQALEPGALRDFLLEILPRRIAVHTSDLTMQEREIVESMAQAGELRLICATSTLAEGLNFPVVNVLTTQRVYSTRLSESETYSAPAPTTVRPEQLLNMTGRAGRLGMSAFGRGILVTCARGDVEGLLRQYEEESLPTAEPLLGRMPFNQVVLQCIGSRRGLSIEQCIGVLRRTLSGVKNRWPAPLEERVGEAVGSLLQGELITLETGRMFPTPLGELVCRSGLSERSARQVNQYVKEQLQESPHPLDVLLLISLLDEMQESYLFVSRSQMQGHFWSRQVQQCVQDHGIELCPMALGLLTHPMGMRTEHHRAFKRALLTLEWIQGTDLLELESGFGLYAGTLTRICEEAAWLIGCLAEAAAAHAVAAEQVQKLFRLQERVLYGLPANGLAWSPYLRRRQIARRDVLKLIEHGMENPSALRPEDRGYVETFASPACVHYLFSVLVPQNQEESGRDGGAETKKDHDPLEESPSALHEVQIDRARPNQIRINGIPVALTPLQIKLIRCLAERAGECVGYSTIYSRVWTESNGDRKLLSQLQKEIAKRLADHVGPLSPTLIETVAREGLLLNARERIP